MRRLIRESIKQLGYTRNSAKAVKPSGNIEKVNKWMHTLNSKSSSLDSKSSCAQLFSLFSFYSKPCTEEIQEINWDQWRQTINTEGVVDKVQKGYNSLMTQQYDVERICNQVVSSQSQDLEELEYELTFHNAVWSNYYLDQTLSLFEMEDLGPANDYLVHENYDLYRGLEADVEELQETHNWIPGSKDDINLRAYMISQFQWGKKVISFYRHPSDDFKAARCTKNILGR